MAMTQRLVLIGTRKGLFVARRPGRARGWELDPIRFANLEVYAVGVDTRPSTPRLFAAPRSLHWGSSLVRSDDLGATWAEPEQAPIAFPEAAGVALARVWQIQPGPADEPHLVYAGAEPHALFRSEDGGVRFSLVQGLFDHPHRPEWMPGNGGACLHTILPHPDDARRVTVAMSTGGVYRTEDGGESWEPANRGIQAYWMPEDRRYPEFGQCVHRLAVHPSRPERLYAQNHFGVYRSDDGGDSWRAIESGLPSTFGFPMVVHPRRPDTVFVFPLQADGERFPPQASCRVYRSDDAGGSWRPLSEGLPSDPYYAAVLRDAMCADEGDPVGLYLGTRLGDVYASWDDGESWEAVASRLPDVLSVRAVALG